MNHLVYSLLLQALDCYWLLKDPSSQGLSKEKGLLYPRLSVSPGRNVIIRNSGRFFVTKFNETIHVKEFCNTVLGLWALGSGLGT